METLTRITDVRARVREAKRAGKTVGLVPTMGALHEGHLSLMRRAREECDLVVVSIFVNPTQFGPREDFARYPRDLPSDEAKCREVGCDIIFAPLVEEMYPQAEDVSGFGACAEPAGSWDRNAQTSVYVEVGGLTELWEGAARPGHFRGVATVVLKLFNIVQPDRAYFGMKDYQQLKVIEKMVRALDVPVEIIACPTVREPDGLAMSSRNVYLSPQERKAATVLYRALELAREKMEAGQKDAQSLLDLLREFIESQPLADTDYIAVADPETLRPLERVTEVAVILLAVRIGHARLIDNAVICLR